MGRLVKAVGTTHIRVHRSTQSIKRVFADCAIREYLAICWHFMQHQVQHNNIIMLINTDNAFPAWSTDCRLAYSKIIMR